MQTVFTHTTLSFAQTAQRRIMYHHLMIMKQRFAHFALLCLMTLSLAAAPAWKHAQATWRLRFGIAYDASSDVLVPIPPELAAGVKAIHALSDAGKTLPASLVTVNGKPVAVAVQAYAVKPKYPGRGKTPAPPALNASIYLLDQPVPQTPPYAGHPVRFERAHKSITTRAHTADEMLRLFARLHLVPYPQSAKSPAKVRFYGRDLANFGVADKPETLAVTSKHPSPYFRGLSIATAAFVVQQEDDYLFSADQPHVGWAVFVDGRPVNAWGRDSQSAPKPLRLRPGLHSLQLLTVQSIGEPLPKPLVQLGKAGKPQPLATPLLPAALPAAIGLQMRDAKGALLEAGAILEPQPSLLFPHADHLALTPYACKLRQNVTLLSPAVQLSPELVLLPHHQQPAFSCAFPGYPKLTLNGAPPLIRPARALELDLLPAPPSWQDASKPMTLALKLRLPSLLPPSLLPHLLCDIRTPEGRQLAQASLQHLEQLTLQPPLPSGSLTLHVTLAGHDLTPPRQLQLLPPVDAHTPLRASGKLLLTAEHGNPATLLLPPEPANSSPVPSVKKKTTGNIALIDDFLLTVEAPGASVQPPEGITLVKATTPPGAVSSLALPTALAAITRLPAATRVCLLVNPAQAAQPSADWSLAIRYLTAVCQARQLLPTLVTLPALGTQDAQAAYNAQCLALQLGIDLINLHTLAQLQQLKTDTWQSAHGVQVATLNDQARHWLFTTLKTQSDRLNQAAPHLTE